MGSGPTLVAGASGLAGAALLEAFRARGETIGTYHTRPAEGLRPLDLTGPPAIDALVREIRPEIVICAAANPYVEGCEADPAGTRVVNVTGTLALARAAQSVGAAFVFLSSEYVFDGAAGPYDEDAQIAPLNVYGRQKAECETALPALVDRVLIARTSGIFGWDAAGKNFVLQLITRLRRGERMVVPSDQVITPTHAGSLAAAVAELVTGRHWGVVHVAGTTPLGRVDFARQAAVTFGLDPELIEPIPTSSLGLRARRPVSAGLSTRKAARLLSTPLLSAREGLERMRQALTQR